MAIKGSSSALSRVILMPNEYKEYIHLTQAAKSASISSVSQIGNASACLSHSSGPWILDSGASDHFSGNKDLFSSLTITSPLPMIPLANGSQTMAKEISSICLLPFVPLTYVLYVPDCLFNLVSISKLTRDFNCLITFSDNSVTLQDRSTGKTIGIGREFQGLFHLSPPSSSTANTSHGYSSLFIVALVIRIFPSFGKWFLVFLVCPQLSVNHVSLRNILVSHLVNA